MYVFLVGLVRFQHSQRCTKIISVLSDSGITSFQVLGGCTNISLNYFKQVMHNGVGKHILCTDNSVSVSSPVISNISILGYILLMNEGLDIVQTAKKLLIRYPNISYAYFRYFEMTYKQKRTLERVVVCDEAIRNAATGDVSNTIEECDDYIDALFEEST